MALEGLLADIDSFSARVALTPSPQTQPRSLFGRSPQPARSFPPTPDPLIQPESEDPPPPEAMTRSQSCTDSGHLAHLGLNNWLNANDEEPLGPDEEPLSPRSKYLGVLGGLKYWADDAAATLACWEIPPVDMHTRALLLAKSNLEDELDAFISGIKYLTSVPEDVIILEKCKKKGKKLEEQFNEINIIINHFKKVVEASGIEDEEAKADDGADEIWNEVNSMMIQYKKAVEGEQGEKQKKRKASGTEDEEAKADDGANQKKAKAN